MSYVDSNLLEGEQVVYRTRLHWKLFVAPLVFALIVAIPLAWIALYGTWSAFAWIPAGLMRASLAAWTALRKASGDWIVANGSLVPPLPVSTISP